MITLNDQTVGQSLTLHCEVTTVRGITSRVDIVWSSNGIVLRRINGTIATTMDNSLVYTDSYNISQLSTTDDGRLIHCEVVINASLPVMASNNLTILSVGGEFILYYVHVPIIYLHIYAVPDPNITISLPGPIVGAVVGSPLIAECTVSTVDGVELSDVMINWTGPGVLTDRFIMDSIISNGNNTYSRTLQLTHLMQADENSTYFCIVMILEASVVESFEIASLTGEDFILPIIKYEIVNQLLIQ